MGSIYDKYKLGEETISWFDKFKTDLDLLRIRTSGHWSGEYVPKDFIVNFIEAVDRDIDYLYRTDLDWYYARFKDFVSGRIFCIEEYCGTTESLYNRQMMPIEKFRDIHEIAKDMLQSINVLKEYERFNSHGKLNHLTQQDSKRGWEDIRTRKTVYSDIDKYNLSKGYDSTGRVTGF